MRTVRGLQLQDGINKIYASVDGTDFRICEPVPFNPSFWSHKFRSAGLRYEIAISLTQGSIVWIYGPFPAGAHNDQRIFNSKMRQHLLENEKVLGDAGYGGPKIVHGSIDGDTNNKQAASLRAYHETINGRIKSFGCIAQRWRHPIQKHHICLFAVANVVQMALVGINSCSL